MSRKWLDFQTNDLRRWGCYSDGDDFLNQEKSKQRSAIDRYKNDYKLITFFNRKKCLKYFEKFTNIHSCSVFKGFGLTNIDKGQKYFKNYWCHPFYFTKNKNHWMLVDGNNSIFCFCHNSAICGKNKPFSDQSLQHVIWK